MHSRSTMPRLQSVLTQNRRGIGAKNAYDACAVMTAFPGFIGKSRSTPVKARSIIFCDFKELFDVGQFDNHIFE